MYKWRNWGMGKWRNCYRFANPAEALRGFEASRICGLYVLDRKRHQNRFSTKTIPSGMNFKMLIVLGCPKGPNQTLRIRIRHRYVFGVIPTSCRKRFSYKNHTFWNEFQDSHCIRTPEGTKPDATHQNPWSICFQCYPDILSKTFFYKNNTFWNEFQDAHCIMTPEGTKPDATHQNPWSIRFFST